MKAPIVDIHKIERVLIVKLSAMGDVVHALPVSAALGEAFPHLRLSWVVEEPFAPLLAGNPYLTSVIQLPRARGKQMRTIRFQQRYLRQLREVRRGRFDLALDLQGLTKSALVAAASGARYRLAYHWLREAAPLLVRSVPLRPQSVHVVDQYLDVARFLGAHAPEARFPMVITKEEDEAAAELLEAAGLSRDRPFLAVNPAAGAPLKQWSPEKFARLMDSSRSRLGLDAALVTADREVAAAVADAAREPFADLTGRTGLRELAAVLARAALHVCGDTGSGHLAAALGTPVIALMGPTDPDRACPYSRRRDVVSAHHLCGVSCSMRSCQFIEPRCIDSITVEQVLRGCEESLGSLYVAS
ncbi:MAG TPA: glycosyltransferase family 9 protein [Chthonomonadales bacterium]|nr:glycosyltransferase family 9 protein [Chthonomonadales bacterium]